MRFESLWRNGVAQGYAPRYAYIAFGLGAVVAIGVSLAIGLFLSYQRAIEDRSAAIANLAISTERQSVGTFESVNQILLSALSAIDLRNRLGRANPDEMRELLDTHIRGQAAVRNIAVIDAGGNSTYEAKPAMPLPPSVAGAEYFRVHAERADVGLHIGVPVTRGGTGDADIPVSRRISGPDGAFGGVIVAFAGADYFANLYKGLIVGGDATITLVRRDGMLLVRQPPFGVVGQSLVKSPLFVDHVPRAPVGTYRVITYLDHVDRVVSYRVSEHAPIVVSLAFDVTGVLALWKKDVFWYVTVSLLCAAAVLTASVALEVGARRRQETEARLRAAQRMESIGQLTGGVAHDFNNLLSVITANLELLGERGLNNQTRIDHLQPALHAASRGASLTQRLLAFGRQQALQPVPTRLSELLPSLHDLLVRTIGESVTLELVLTPGLASCMIDPGQLENAILNLVINARDAMPNGGRIVIEAKDAIVDRDRAARSADVPEGRFVIVSVSDQGTGMTPEVRARAFEPFFTTKPVGKGSGLGLSMVYGFVKQSGGHVKLHSEVGRGTTVSLYLPQTEARQAADVEAPRAPAAMPPKAMLSGTVLIVEDQPDVRAAAVAQYSVLGFDTLSAGSGREALNILRMRDNIRLLFTDVVLGDDINGPALAAEAVRLHPELRVLYASGYIENAVIHHYPPEAGARVLTKPYSRTQLLQAITSVLGA